MLSEFNILILVYFMVKLVSSSTTEEKINTYEQHLNTSIQVEKQDKADLRSWSEEFQVEMVEVTTKYRLEMNRHQQHSFRRKSKNDRWQECLKFYENATNKLERTYYINENVCLRNASSADANQKQTVLQIGKEIQKWRRTYRYLLKICRENKKINRDCLVKNMERDNFAAVFSRLMTLRSEALQDLRREMTRAIASLEECLQSTLSTYLEGVRETMDVMAKCYGETTPVGIYA